MRSVGYDMIFSLPDLNDLVLEGKEGVKGRSVVSTHTVNLFYATVAFR